MDLGELGKQNEREIPTGKLTWVGQNNHLFNSDEIGEILGTEIEIHHVLPHTDRMISHPDHVHAIIKREGAEKTEFWLDLKVERSG